METHPLSEIAIKVRIVPRRGQLPNAQSSKVWTAVHDCILAYETVVRDVESACMAFERDKDDLSPDAIRRRRSQICEQGLARLVGFRPLEMAEKALTQRISALESLNERNSEQVRSLNQLTQALADLRQGIEATKRTILEICKVRQGVAA